MAFTGLNVTCCRVGGFGRGRAGLVAILGPAIWSSNMTAAGTTSQAAPPEDSSTGTPCFSVYAAVDAWVATGSNPDATTGPRHLVPAGVATPIIADAGDKLAWIPVP